ncbi:MAG: GNAT family N-acetyltransferase [Lentimicrobium sp.]|nr:GNAT family N-acetyltransferase [Lentimicrobium sp.]
MKNNSNIDIRLACSDEADYIANSQVSMAWETEEYKLDIDAVSQGVMAVFDDPGKGFYLIAQSGGINCGCLLITPEWSDWRNSWVWWIQSVYVLPAYRKEGVFGTMYDYIRQLVLQRNDVAGIRLYVDNTNLRAREVYNRMGMNGEHYRTFEWMKPK